MTSNSCSSTQMVPYMVFGMASSTRGHLVRAPGPQTGSKKPPRLEVVGTPSSSSSLILRECCMAFMEISCTKGSHQLPVVTTGLDPPHWWGQVDGRSFSFSSSTHGESYTAWKTASFSRGLLPNLRVTTGYDQPHSLALAAGIVFSSFSSWLMVTCTAFTVAGSTNDQSQPIEVITGCAPRRWLAQVAGLCSNTWCRLCNSAGSRWEHTSD